MRVVVAGAAGFLGRSAVRALRAGGHDVIGLVRSPTSAAAVRADGGTPVVADLRRAADIVRPLVGCDAVLHLAQPADGSVAERRAVRVEGGRHLAAAAADAGVGRIVVGSGYWVHASNPGTITETSPVAPRSISLVNYETEAAVRRAAEPAGMSVVVVRPGMVYGPGSWFAEMARDLGEGTYRYIAPGTNRLSPVHLEDAGEAFRVLLERGATGGTYFVVDDLPVPTQEFAEYVS